MTQTKAELLQTRHQGDIRLGDADSSHYVGFKAPATVGTSLVWTLPAADGTANYLLKTDGSGNLGWVADSSTDSTKMPLAGGIFTGDVTFDGATAGRDIVFDRSDNALEFADNATAAFGSSTDLQIWHDGTSSFIVNGNTGQDLYVQSKRDLYFKVGDGSGGNHTCIYADNNGGVQLKHDNTTRIATNSTGVAITGGLDIGDGVHNTSRIAIGDADDLCLYHNGSNSFLVDRGTGPLYVRGNAAVRIEKYVDDSNGEPMIIANADGAVELYHDNVKKFNTSAEGVVITGVTATDPSAIIYHSNADVEGEWLRLGRTDLSTIRYHSLKAKHGGGATGNEISFFLHNGSTTTSQTEVLTLSGNAKTTFGGAIFTPVKTVSALELDLSTGNYFIKTISGNSTFTFANPAASGTVTAFTLELTHSSGTVTWPSSVKWNADTAPTLTTGKTHLFMFVTDDGGSRYRGSALVDYVN